MLLDNVAEVRATLGTTVGNHDTCALVCEEERFTCGVRFLQMLGGVLNFVEHAPGYSHCGGVVAFGFRAKDFNQLWTEQIL